MTDPVDPGLGCTDCKGLARTGTDPLQVADKSLNRRIGSGAIQGGSSIEDAVTALTGDKVRTRALIEDSYKIADALYQAAPSPDKSEPQGGNLLSDLGKLTVSGALRGTGSVVKGLGVAADITERARACWSPSGD